MAILTKPHIYIDGIPVNTNVAKAAPEMLRALLSAYSDLRCAQAVMHENSPEISKEIQDTIDKVKSAIEKANL